MNEPLDWYEPHPVFVYGTLRRGLHNHERCCFDAVSVTPAWTEGRLYEMTHGLPAMIEGPGRVHGDLLAFPQPRDAIRRLDSLEGFMPGTSWCWYRRVLTRVFTDAEPEGLLAWCYVMDAEKLGESPRPVPSGDWALRTAQREACA